MVSNHYSKYQKNSINTASKEELTLMLYEGALKFCNQAIIAIERKEIAQAHSLIIKAENIIEELQSSLNYDYEISDNFNSLYTYMYRRLTEANIAKDKEILIEVCDLFREFRDMWKEAMKLSKQPKTV